MLSASERKQRDFLNMDSANRFGGFGNRMGADSPSGRPAGGDRKQQKPLRPVTIHQLLSAQRVGDGALVIDGTEAGQVTIVGIVMGCETSEGNNGTTQHTYRLCDGTGIITVRTWTSESAAEVSTYVRASGNVGSFQNNLSITGMVRTVSNSSEVAYHQMDCALTHLRITQGTRTAGNGAPSQQQQQQQQQQQSSQQHQPFQQQQQVYGAPQPPAQQQSFSGEPRDLMIAAIRNAGPAGLTVPALSDAVRQWGLAGEVRDVVRALNAEGTIFTQNNTIFLSTSK